MADTDEGIEGLSVDEEGEEVITVKLSKPIEAYGKQYDELVFREPALGELKQADVAAAIGGFALLERLISVSARVPPKSAGGIRARDVGACKRALTYFLPDLVADRT